MPCPNCSCTSCLPTAGSSASLAELPPPPPELMTTNRAPTNPEVASSRAVIDSAERRISMIQAMLNDLERRKTELLDFVRAHKAAVSPLRSFPPELLVELFSQWATVAVGRFPKNCPPLMVMGVCSRWRRIALDTPRLWTKISRAIPRRMIDSWVVRSKGLPLSVQLCLSRRTASLDSTLETLIPHVHRWERVNFTLGPSANSALAPVKARLHSLKRLKLSCSHVTGTVDFCEVAPQLTEISLKSVARPIAIKLPWEQLRVCTVDNSRVALHVLHQAKHLRKCHLDMRAVFDRPPRLSMSRDPHIHHPELDTLIIDWGVVDYTTASFFSLLTLSSLRTLELRFPSVSPDPGEEYSDTMVPFSSTISKFFERSSAHLNTLNLAGIIPLYLGELISCLAFAPSLVSLDIQYLGSEIGNDLLNSLNTNLPGSILHRLRSLSFRGWSTFSEGCLDALVTSRRGVNPTGPHQVALLENLILDCAAPRDRSQPPSFHRFVSEGLNITYGPYWHIQKRTRPQILISSSFSSESSDS